MKKSKKLVIATAFACIVSSSIMSANNAMSSSGITENIFNSFREITGQPWPENVDQKIADVKKTTKVISMEEFHKLFEKKDYDLIVDVREPGEYASGHLPGAINIPRGLLEFKVWKHIGFPKNTDANKRIFLYCKVGGRAILSANALTGLGLTNAVAVNMKVDKWKGAGYPLETEQADTSKK
ncbi:rhodanese-like domain-containing protein [Desulfobulbus sp. US2]|nr:rhodanese-like domain-containing protein [Desulfobulbus sp. US2]